MPSKGAIRGADIADLAGEPQNIGHGIKTRLLVFAPKCGLDGAARENAAVFRDVSELNPLARSRENHFVIADHRPSAKRYKADIADSAQASMAIARADRMLFECDATAFRRRPTEKKSGAGWRVDLHAMMHFDDLDVIFWPQRAGGFFDESGEEIDAKAHVAGAHKDCMTRGGL